jgi:SAM-dependent methyltransferase
MAYLIFQQFLQLTGRVIVTKTWSFDSDLTQRYTRIRQKVISDFLDGINGQIPLQSAIDIGCGVGYFSKFLWDRGLNIIAVDGRDENAKEGQRRYPEIRFLTRDAEDPTLAALGVFDLVLCVGLIYHLENPFRAIRNFYTLTGKVLVVESVCAPSVQPSLELVDEPPLDNQGLNYVAFYPTESCLIKMLYRAGFPFVYGFKRLPDEIEFKETRLRKKERTMLVASKDQLNWQGLVLLKEPKRHWDLWAIPESPLRLLVSRIWAFLRRCRAHFFPRGHGAAKT